LFYQHSRCPIEHPPIRKSIAERWIQANSTIWSKPEVHFSIPKGNIYSRVGIYLILSLSCGASSLWLLKRLRQFQCSPSENLSQSNENTRAESLAGKLLEVQSTTSNILSADSASSVIRRRKNTVYESDSEESIWTILDDYKSDPYMTTFREDVITVFATLLTTDPFVQELCGIGVSRLSEGRFQRHLRRLLKEYCFNLEHEASTKTQRRAIKIIDRNSRSIAQEVYHRITMQEATAADRSMDQRKARLADYLLQQGINQGSPRDDLYLDPIILWLTESTAFWKLREHLRGFLFPKAWNTYRAGARDIISHNKPKMITTGIPVG
jgi:hypothetical protein